ncbi:MAG TPA: ABC transporter permease [Terriglobales bacterium]|nr:ABC transporter permease [Terriglobales bacterium]
MATSATTVDQLIAAPVARAQIGLWQDAWRRLRRNRLALVSAAYLIGLVVVALVGIVYTPYPYAHEGVGLPYMGPGAGHLLGTDQAGRDIFSRIMIGAQVSLIVGLATQAVVLAVGVPLGLMAGYFRGWIDTALSFVISVFYGIPDILVAMILIVLIGKPGLGTIIIAIAATRWMDMARLTRGQTLSLREREFVEASRSSGGRPAKILFGHVLPNALGPIIVQATLGIPAAILFEAFLSFLGLGVPSPTPSWGSMAADGIHAIRIAPHIVLAPAIGLSITLMAFNFLGDGLRDALDPRQRR